ncbi:MAG: ABC transporter substrate-binding protein [Bdellovibrionota bacterium]
MNKKIVVFISILFLALCGVLLVKKSQKGHDKYVIGLIQSASFPNLDYAREGFIAEIKKELGAEKVEIIVQNAEGSLTQAQAIASSFKANKNIDAFYAIATTAAQALKREITDKPIVFAAVTDPVGLHMRDKNSNMTGSSDMADIPKQILYIKELLPNVKKVALLYNVGEPNSVTLVKSMKEELTKQNILFEDDGINSESDVAAATAHAVVNAELILVPTDNSVTSAFPIVKQIAKKAHIPVVVTWTGESKDPLMQFGVDYKQSGEQAAQLMAEILVDKKAPIEIPFVFPTNKVLLSASELKIFNITIPESLKSIVTVY